MSLQFRSVKTFFFTSWRRVAFHRFLYIMICEFLFILRKYSRVVTFFIGLNFRFFSSPRLVVIQSVRSKSTLIFLLREKLNSCSTRFRSKSLHQSRICFLQVARLLRKFSKLSTNLQDFRVAFTTFLTRFFGL